MKIIKTFLLIACTISILACLQATPDKTVYTNAMANTTTNSAEVAKPPSVSKPASNAEQKPEVKHGLTDKGRKLIGVEFDVAATPSGKLNLYNITYIANPTNNTISEVTAYTIENELICLELRYTPLKKMVRFMYHPDKGISFDNGGKKTVAISDPKPRACFDGTKKIIGIYQSTLKKPPEDQLENLFYDDCAGFSSSWMIPIDDNEKDFDPDKYSM